MRKGLPGMAVREGMRAGQTKRQAQWVSWEGRRGWSELSPMPGEVGKYAWLWKWCEAGWMAGGSICGKCLAKAANLGQSLKDWWTGTWVPLLYSLRWEYRVYNSWPGDIYLVGKFERNKVDIWAPFCFPLGRSCPWWGAAPLPICGPTLVSWWPTFVFSISHLAIDLKLQPLNYEFLETKEPFPPLSPPLLFYDFCSVSWIWGREGCCFWSPIKTPTVLCVGGEKDR